MKTKTFVMGLLLLLCSCTGFYQIDRYDLNKTYMTEAGSPMVVREKCWGDSYYGAANSKHCVLRQELFYSGKEGDVIYVTYKEYVGQDSNYPSKESFLQHVGYDLRYSDIVNFRDIYFKVIEASKKSIEFMVIDPLRYQPYPVY